MITLFNCRVTHPARFVLDGGCGWEQPESSFLAHYNGCAVLQPRFAEDEKTGRPAMAVGFEHVYSVEGAPKLPAAGCGQIVRHTVNHGTYLAHIGGTRVVITPLTHEEAQEAERKFWEEDLHKAQRDWDSTKLMFAARRAEENINDWNEWIKKVLIRFSEKRGQLAAVQLAIADFVSALESEVLPTWFHDLELYSLVKKAEYRKHNLCKNIWPGAYGVSCELRLWKVRFARQSDLPVYGQAASLIETFYNELEQLLTC